jgi:hypothetical protein
LVYFEIFVVLTATVSKIMTYNTIQTIKIALQIAALYGPQVYEIFRKLITCFGDEMWKETVLSFIEAIETEISSKT